MKPNKAVLVVGNGFDLDLGFKTRYCDFANSAEWQEMFAKEAYRSCHYSLLKYLNDRRNTDNWFDIELALKDYTHVKTNDIWIHDKKTDEREFHIICKTLKAYLISHIENSSADITDTYAATVLRCFQRDADLRKIYTFNYTPLDLISRCLGLLHFVPYEFVHGSVSNDDMILGFETESPESVIPGYEFLLKSSNKSYKHTELQNDMGDAEEVVIFGHSLNMIDSILFEDYFKELAQQFHNNRRLTIITKDLASHQAILHNIRKMGVSVPKLFSRAQLEFIHSSDAEDTPKLTGLLHRIDSLY